MSKKRIPVDDGNDPSEVGHFDVPINERQALLYEMAKRQGVKPIKDVKDLYGDLFSKDESVDDFLTWLDELRHSDRNQTH